MNLTDSSPSELIFGRYEFVDESPAVAIPILMIIVFASFIGTFGNILILITIITTKNLQRLECIFMANLAFSDIYVTLLADPLSIVGKYYLTMLVLFLYVKLFQAVAIIRNEKGAIPQRKSKRNLIILVLSTIIPLYLFFPNEFFCRNIY